MKILVSLSRIIVGGLFIFSGVIKANDPYGFSYKLEEYFVVFEESFHIGFTALEPMSLIISIFLVTLEIVLGVAVLTGWKMRFNGWLLLLLTLFFTWLTGFSHFTGKVTDCGCFGDAIPLTPKESFIKDLILLVFVGLIFYQRNAINKLKGALPISSVGASAVITIAFSIWCITHLPVWDFRPYKVGNNIPELMKSPTGEADIYETMLLYENTETGEKKWVKLEDIPSDPVWQWRETENKLIFKAPEAPIHDFSITDQDGNDITEEVLADNNYYFIVVSTDVKKASEKGFLKLNEIASKSEEKGYNFMLLTASSYDDSEPFRHEVQAAYNFYSTDATTLKTIIRSSPGLLLLKGGTILAKYHHNDIPSFDKIADKYITN